MHSTYNTPHGTGSMPISAKTWANDHPFSSLHDVEMRIREFLAENPDKGYTAREIYDAVIPSDKYMMRNQECEPVQQILAAMYCNGRVNTIRLDVGIISPHNVRCFRHRPETEPFFEPGYKDPNWPDRFGETERKPNHDMIGR